jgi:pimeloyl-ACP methyl ester carboxylesterase
MRIFQDEIDWLKSWLELTYELKAIPEIPKSILTLPTLRNLPKGDGRSVFFLPGYKFSDIATFYLRKVNTWLRYKGLPWGQGTNNGFNEQVGASLYLDIKREFELTKRKVSIVGWSLGGTIAKIFSDLYPQYVRSVITLDAPTSIPIGTAIYRIYQWKAAKNQVELEKVDPALMDRLGKESKVPYSAIWSNNEKGLLPGRFCRIEPTRISENIIVDCSHLGFLYMPYIISIIADRLAEPVENWQPYQAKERKRKAIFTPNFEPELQY